VCDPVQLVPASPHSVAWLWNVVICPIENKMRPRHAGKDQPGHAISRTRSTELLAATAQSTRPYRRPVLRSSSFKCYSTSLHSVGLRLPACPFLRHEIKPRLYQGESLHASISYLLHVSLLPSLMKSAACISPFFVLRTEVLPDIKSW
jgi:hypothetical protein